MCTSEFEHLISLALYPSPALPPSSLLSYPRVILRSCCNATGEMILTNQNTKSGQKIHYETNQKLFKTVDKKLHSMLPKDLPWSNGLLGHCAVVGSGGILQNSSCGAEIDNADYVIRYQQQHNQSCKHRSINMLLVVNYCNVVYNVDVMCECV